MYEIQITYQHIRWGLQQCHKRSRLNLLCNHYEIDIHLEELKSKLEMVFLRLWNVGLRIHVISSQNQVVLREKNSWPKLLFLRLTVVKSECSEVLSVQIKGKVEAKSFSLKDATDFWLLRYIFFAEQRSWPQKAILLHIMVKLAFILLKK